MSEPEEPYATGPGWHETRLGPTWLVALASASLLIAVIVAVTMFPDDEPSRSALESVPATDSAPSSASCVERYSVETLREREFAFDGTVADADGDEVTFDVAHWYAGESAPRVTLRGAEAFGSVSSVGSDGALEPRTRWLVAGDDDFLWACGFTQPYDAETAEKWAETVG